MFEKKTINPIYDICFYLPYNYRVKVIRGGFFKFTNKPKSYLRQQGSIEVRYIGVGLRLCLKIK